MIDGNEIFNILKKNFVNDSPGDREVITTKQGETGKSHPV